MNKMITIITLYLSFLICFSTQSVGEQEKTKTVTATNQIEDDKTPKVKQEDMKQKRPFKIYMIIFAKNFGECERGFTNYMRSRGINIEYTIRDCNGLLAGCPLDKYIKEAKEMKPDMIYTWGTPITTRVAGVMGAVDLKKNITDIPIMALPIANPVGAKLTPKMNVPTNRNLAGVSQMMPVVEQIRAIRIYGNFKRIGAIFTPYEPNISTFIDEWHAEEERLKDTKEAFEFTSYPIGLEKPGKLDRASIPGLLQKLLDHKIQFLYMGPDTAILDHRDLIIDWCIENKIPIFASSELTIEKVSPTLGFFSRFYHVGQLAGFMAEQILFKRFGGSTEEFPKEHYQFKTLKHMSYTVNVEDGIEMDIPPPISLIKFAQIIKRKDDYSDDASSDEPKKTAAKLANEEIAKTAAKNGNIQDEEITHDKVKDEEVESSAIEDEAVVEDEYTAEAVNSSASDLDYNDQEYDNQESDYFTDDEVLDDESADDTDGSGFDLNTDDESEF